MAAPDFSTLYDFETQMEDAFADAIATALSAASITAQVNVTRGDEIGSTPRIDINFSPGNAMTQRTAAGQILPKQVPNAFEGSLRVRICSARPIEDDDSAIHGVIRGWVRYALSAGAKLITISNLPYLEILEMLPTSAVSAITDEKTQDVSELSYNVWFAIRNSAWPSEAPAGDAFSSGFSSAFG